MYFGTTSKASGHHLTVLNGSLAMKDQCRIGQEIDADESLYSDIRRGKGIRYVYYRGVRMLHVPYSVHDSRPGSKSSLWKGTFRKRISCGNCKGIRGGT